MTSHDRRVGLLHAAAPAWCVGERRTSHRSEFPPERATVARQRFRQLVGEFRPHLFSKIRLHPSREHGPGGATRLQPLSAPTTMISGDHAARFQHRRAQR